jgi:hypothetical protein
MFVLKCIYLSAKQHFEQFTEGDEKRKIVK